MGEQGLADPRRGFVEPISQITFLVEAYPSLFTASLAFWSNPIKPSLVIIPDHRETHSS